MIKEGTKEIKVYELELTECELLDLRNILHNHTSDKYTMDDSCRATFNKIIKELNEI